MEGGDDKDDDVNLFGSWDVNNIQQSGATNRSVFNRQTQNASPSPQHQPGLQVTIATIVNYG
jgi:hypothetical protein